MTLVYVRIARPANITWRARVKTVADALQANTVTIVDSPRVVPVYLVTLVRTRHQPAPKDVKVVQSVRLVSF